jgi:glyoxylate reductase
MGSTPSVLVTRRLPSAVLAPLEAAFDVEVYRGEGGMPHAELRSRVADKQALISVLTDQIDRSVMESAPDLRVVANVAVGYDNIDVRYARRRGIVVTNTPDVLTDAVAEFTWALILAVTRRLVEGDRLVRDGRWGGWALDFMLGSSLRDKQLGIVGFGRIGRAVAARAPAFGMSVVYARTSPSRRADAAGDGPADSAAQGDGPAPRLVPFDQLLRGSDVVSLHVPMTAETRHLIDQRALARMKRTAYLINTARGPVVDEEALAWAIGERLIAGAALDVYEREPQVHQGLVGLENVVLAPHLGSATRETRTAMADLAARNVSAVLSGKPPLTPVQA